MDKSELLMEISKTLVKVKVEKLAAISSENSYSVSDLLDLTFHPKKEIAFRAAWILECIMETDPQRFSSHIAEFLIRYPLQTNLSCQRHFSKILMYLTDQKGRRSLRLPDNYNIEPLIEKTFEWLIDPKSPVAVRVYCMNVLFNLRQQFTWIEEELKAKLYFSYITAGQPCKAGGRLS